MSPYIGTEEWANQNPGKLGVIRLQFGWYVVSKDGYILRIDGKNARFPTHADAIEYAHEQATRQALAARFNIPPETEPTC